MQTRRAHLAALAGAAASALLPRRARAQALATPAEPPAASAAASSIPPEGIGRGIRHVSYSDQGGRPDGVQVMVNRGHLYVGHMFSDGVTVLDARDPRELKPVHFFSTPSTRARITCRRPATTCLLANGANIARSQSLRQLARLLREHARGQHREREPFRAGLSIFDIAKNPAKPREIAFLEMPGLRRQPALVGRRPLRVRVGALRRLHRSHPVHRRLAATSRSRRSCRAGGCPACTAPAARPRRTRPASATRCIT